MRVGLAPCSPFSVTGDLLRESAALARERGVRLHTHLCETQDEEAYCLEHFGMRPIDYAAMRAWWPSVTTRKSITRASHRPDAARRASAIGAPDLHEPARRTLRGRRIPRGIRLGEAFRRLRAELTVHGAPTGLRVRAERAVRDEVPHARITPRRWRGVMAQSRRPSIEPGEPRSLEEVARENAVEGCVMETFGRPWGWARAAPAIRSFAAP